MRGTRDLGRIASYHRGSGVAGIDERTWSDLDLDDVVARIDTTRSGAGQQLLYHLVRTPLVDRDALAERERLLARAAGKRAALTRELAPLAKLDLYDVHQLFRRELPDPPPSLLLFPIVSLLSLLAVASAFVVPQGIFALIVMAAVTFGIYYTYRRRIFEFIQPVTVLKRLLDAGERIAAILGDDALQRAARSLAPLRRASRWLVMENLQADNLAGFLYHYLNMFLLLDVNAFVFSLETIRTRVAELERIFAGVGMTDALLAVDSFRASARTAIPEFTDTPRRAEFERLVHPLLDDGVANDLVLAGRSVLVTGSNMSGKTTFLRAAGVNAVLAQTIHTVCADRWRAPLLRVRTSIGKADSLAEGRSYYLREVDDIRALVVAAEGAEPHLFIVDELFRGTNTQERVAAGAAVLRHLARGPHLALASTHDLELLALLGDVYEFHHFRESIESGDLTFDYTLRPGPSSTRNAIAILAMRDFPPRIVEEALRTLADQYTVPS
ncbi:MAG: hypothetical protein JO197_00345 [Acidobacteria bacterium]|nr:hypothetical protein [Acidobacteriota bacterium]MBV9474691.1 hypothetical protein [Acidobacteriota bacterium]